MRRGAVGKDEDMEAYSSFAEVYDIFQDNVPYEEWCSYVIGLLREQGVENGLVLDLGCGSGILSIAALVLGAERASAVDIDPKAVDVAYENATLNGLSLIHI